MQRWIAENRGDIEADDYRGKKDLFRAAARLGLISDAGPWFSFHEARNLSSHTYDEGRTAKVCKLVPAFLIAVCELLTQLEAHND